MTGRDFSTESFVNLALRAFRAGKGRAIGVIYSSIGVFGWFDMRGLFFASMPRVMNSKSIALHRHVHFGLSARIECYPAYSNRNGSSKLIEIGAYTSFGDYLHIGSTNKITIGNYVLGGSNILVIDHNHGRPGRDMKERNSIPPRLRAVTSYSEIIVGDNVWIGDNCVILQGAVIEEGAIIPAGSTVNERVPAYTIFGKNE